MTQIGKLWAQTLAQRGTIPFRDFERLLRAFGFVCARISGSHHIYVHRMTDRPLSVQPRNGEAKAYQVKQFIDIIERYGLKIKD